MFSLAREIRIILGASVIFGATITQGSDLGREQAYAAEIIAALVVGEEVFLQSDGESFLGLYAEEEGSYERGAVLLLHGQGVHPNWPDVIFPLREALPAHGWANLSLQMPIAGREASFDEYLELFPEVAGRIDAGLAYLQGLGHSRVVLVGHSFGALMAASYLADTPGTGIQAFGAIGLPSTEVLPAISTVGFLERIRLPVLDLYGELDRPNVADTAWVREATANGAGNEDYVQVQVAGADHFFRNKNDALVESVLVWLDDVFPL